MMNCKICNSLSEKVFNGTILKKYNIEYFYCKNCGFLFTENPFWLKEAYNNPINDSDTGLVGRNIYFSKIISPILFFYFSKDGKYLDYAGGYGVFVRLMRDIGFDFYWYDVYTSNLFAKGFEYNETSTEKITLLTAFECFEHFSEPVEELKKMLEISRNIILSTELLPASLPKPNEWWYYGLEHGQHISFYSKSTFRYIANSFGLNFYSFGQLHILTEKKLNSFILPILIKFAGKGAFSFIRKILKSKTIDDSDLMGKLISSK